MKSRLRPWALVVLGGVLLPISFCGFDQWYLTWVAFVPLLGAIEGSTRRQAALRGFVYGLIANQIGYYWIPYTIYEFGRFPQVLAYSFSLILCAYQGVQYSLLAYMTVRLREGGRWPLLLIFPTIMVGLETVYPLLFPIFMGNTQHVIPLLCQSADLLGPLLISFVILLFNASLYLGIKAAAAREAIPWRQVLVGPAVLLLMIAYGAVRIPMVEAAMARGTELNVGIVQPSMGILEKWRDVEEGLERHNERSLELERQGAELIIWSEAAYTAGYIHPERQRNLRRLMAPGLHTPLLAGALTMYQNDGERRRHNSALMLDAEGNLTGTYDKTYLLAFGEYLPFGDVFPQIYEASPNTGRLQAGNRVDALPLEHDGQRWSLGVLICYEDIIPQFTRQLVRHASPDLLVNMTNDAWFGDTNEPWIHMDLAKFRAIEHRRYLVRATNTGVSAVIDPVGRLAEHVPEVFVEASLQATVRLLRDGRTLYAAVGDSLGYLALLLLGVGLIMTRTVWLRAPSESGRRGITQPAGVLLAVAIWDGLSLIFVLVLRPAGWTPAPYEYPLWLGSIIAMVASFVLLRRGQERGLKASYLGVVLRLLLTISLIATTTAAHLAAVSALVGLPLSLAVAAAATLWLWRDRCPQEEAASGGGADSQGDTAEKAEDKAEGGGAGRKKKSTGPARKKKGRGQRGSA